MSKKSPKYMMISGWLPASYSHYKNLESWWVGIEDLPSDKFYGSLKMIADDLNDGLDAKKIKKNVKKYLKDTDIAKCRSGALEYFIEAAFTFVDDYYAISKYYMEVYRDTQDS